jgi:hypothetical protein
MKNPEKLAKQGTQDDERQNKNTTRYVLDTTIRKQKQQLIFIVCLCSNNGVQIQADDKRVLFTSLEGVDARIISYLLHSINLPH